jgi:hypothetical protein
MKKLKLLLAFALISIAIAGQKTSDYGILGGVTSYFGDINPGRPLYSPLPAGGIFYRLNFHPRQSVRGSLLLGGLRGNDLDFNNSYQLNRKASFAGTVGEATVQFEFNFLPFSTTGKPWDYSAYIAGGLGVAYFSSFESVFEPVIPFSAGFKVNIYKNLGLEAEYGFRKTFYDNFDGLTDQVAPSDIPWLHDNDWYTFAGLAFTWKIYGKTEDCPAYTGTDFKRKRK